MTKKLVTIEELQASLEAQMAAFDAANKVAKASEAKLNLERGKLRRIQLAIEANREVNLANMLEVILPSGENSVGHKWLADRTWRGDWKDTGFGRATGYWTLTNQYGLGVRIPDRDFTNAQLATLEKIITDAMPSIKAGAYDTGTLTLMSKGSNVELSTLKILDISDSGCDEYANWQLALMPTGEWVIFDSYTTKYSFGRARLTGTLGECLREIRQYLNADSGREDEDED